MATPIDKIFHKIFGNPSQQFVKKSGLLVKQINDLESKFASFSVEQLKNQTEEFKKQLAAGKTLDDILAEAFACVREASKRSLKLRHFDVQLVGGLALHQGNIAEMK